MTQRDTLERKSRLIGQGDIKVSFEFFPPKTEKLEQALWQAINRLEPLDPEFVSVTYGAGGSTRERTHKTLAAILAETHLVPAGHLTCVDATREEVDDVIRSYWDLGVRHIVALRGDPPDGVGARYEPHPGGYANAAELVAGIRKIAEFDISVGGYPEIHPESPSLQADLDNLKAKLDAGATISVRSRSSRANVARRYRRGSPTASRASRRIPRRRISSPPPSRLSRSWIWSTTGFRPSTSTR
jgi:methylenetetrahydrofolate reductase (NADPH)